MELAPQSLTDLLVSAVTAIATLGLAWVVHGFSRRQTTLTAINHLSSTLAPLDRRLSANISPQDDLRPAQVEIILTTPELLADVLEFLNAYESFASGVNHGVLNRKVSRALRGETLVASYDRFKPFIEEWKQNLGTENAWGQLAALSREWSTA